MKDKLKYKEEFVLSRGFLYLGRAAREFKSMGITQVNLFPEEDEITGFPYINARPVEPGNKPMEYSSRIYYSGRIHIPGKLRSHAGLENGKKVFVVRFLDSNDVEIWNKKTDFIQRLYETPYWEEPPLEIF